MMDDSDLTEKMENIKLRMARLLVRHAQFLDYTMGMVGVV